MEKQDTCKEVILRSSSFQKLNEDELKFIEDNKTLINYSKGENLCKQGAFASYVMFVSSGLIKLYLENVSSKFTNIRILKSTEFIGLSSIFEENIYNYSAIALKESNVCLIEKEALKTLILKNGAFASEIMRGFCQNETLLYNRIKSISYKQMNGRLADTLLYFSSEELLKEDIFKYLSRKDIADYACISKESTVKLLTEFKTEKLIDIDGKSIKILELEKLKNISKRG